MADLGQQLREMRERAEFAEAELAVAKGLKDTLIRESVLTNEWMQRATEHAADKQTLTRQWMDERLAKLGAQRRAEQAEAELAACQAERDAAHRRADALVQGTLDAEATLHRLIADQREKREQAEAALADLELDFTSFQEHHAATEAALAERDAELAELKVDPDACATTGHGDVRCERCHQVWPGKTA
jgi:chromosome segregation ATPase